MHAHIHQNIVMVICTTSNIRSASKCNGKRKRRNSNTNFLSTKIKSSSKGRENKKEKLFVLKCCFEPKRSTTRHVRSLSLIQNNTKMLHIVKENVKKTQDSAQFYANHNKRPCVFIIGQKVFLCSHTNSKSLTSVLS